MYKLYTNKGARTCLDIGDEFDVLTTMEECLQKDENMEFLLVHYDEETTEPDWRTIKGRVEYMEYLKQYYHKIKLQNKSVMELRKEMMDIVYDKPKTKGTR